MPAHDYALLNEEFNELGDNLPTLFTDMTEDERTIYISNMDKEDIISQCEGMR